MTLPAPSFAHLRRLTDDGGLYEHARHLSARRAHGYCLDDVARALVVVCREQTLPPEAIGLREQYLDFVLASQADDGRFRNRRDTELRWRDRPSVDDCWGRAMWGLGAAVAAAPDVDGTRALSAFDRGAGWTSPSPRSMASASFGAAAVLSVIPDHDGARAIVAATAMVIGRPRAGTGWIWPEARLAYANAALPEALLVAGDTLDLPALTADGLRLLDWLLARQTRAGHLSVVPVGGWGPTDTGPGFDQQPIEVSALADACARAYALTGDSHWAKAVELAANWFLGSNDTGVALYDPVSGGGCDGLMLGGRNENQGAESTIALISTLQHAQLLMPSLR